MILTTILVVVGLCFGGVGAENESIQSDQDSKLCEARKIGASWSCIDNESVNDAPIFRSLVNAPAVIRECCQYPILLATANDANVTRQNFKCAEPISLKCHRDKNGQFVKLAIAGTNDQFKTFTLVSFPTFFIHFTSHFQLAESEMTLLERTVICSSSLFRSKWHLEGSEDEFSSFTCLSKSKRDNQTVVRTRNQDTFMATVQAFTGCFACREGTTEKVECYKKMRGRAIVAQLKCPSTVSFVTCDSKGRINSSKFSELWSRGNGGFNCWKVDGREEV
ncbi:hypothetical protein CRE_08479 [Caenorhabditis remanei]|uniref:Uncharacterized protein n=1 Tax=Caenorhabditis remanei TaxID=31234 RepID=E3N6T6_CAERE|nr:hypothetical protein CRE_08479 [Caenorhabditis remanei]